MYHKIYNKFLARIFCTVGLWSILLTGCTGETTPDTIESIETTQLADGLVLFQDGITEYTIVRPDNETHIGGAAAIEMRKLMTASGIEMKITTDWKDQPVSEYEIVIGDTTRTPEQGNTMNSGSIETDDFYIYTADKRIYIGGGSEEAVEIGVRTFLYEFFRYTGDADALSGVDDVIVPKDYSRIEAQYPMEALLNGKEYHERTLIVNGIARDSVTVVTGDSPAEMYAGTELKKYLKKVGISTGNDLTISMKVDDTLGDDSYCIQIEDDGISITGGNGRGVIYGAYGFLETYGDMQFFTPELEDTGSGDILVDKGYTYTPVFELRQTDWRCVLVSPDWCVKNGINICDWYGDYTEEMGGNISYGGLFVHTFAQLTDTPRDIQPCMTDPENLKKAIAYIRKVLKEKPDTDIVSVSINDNGNYCQCENCLAVDAEEESHAGAMLRFVNAVAADLAEDYPDLIIDTIAYNYARKAPAITRPLPNVCVRVCSLRCDFTHTLTDETCGENVEFCRDLQAWMEICDNIYVWDYTTNYRYLLPTYANLAVLRENMRYYADNGVKGMFPQGNAGSQSGEFGELRAYLLAKLMMNPMMSEEEYYNYMDRFLEAYYGDGWSYIRSYIDEVCAEAASGCQSIYGHPFEAVSEAFYLSKEETFEMYWSEAEKLAGDRLEAVQRSRLQWRYIRLMLHPNEEDAKKLIEDVKEAGLWWTDSRKDLPEDVDLSKSPAEWYKFSWWL